MNRAALGFLLVAMAVVASLDKVLSLLCGQGHSPDALQHHLLHLFLGCLLVVALSHLAGPRWREEILVAVSLLLLASLSLPLAGVFLLATLLLAVILRLARFRWLLFAVWMAALYAGVPNRVLPIAGLNQAETLVGYYFLVSSFRRALFAYFEVSIGRVGSFRTVSLLAYMIGLPFLTGLGCCPSFRHFLDCLREVSPASSVSGVKTGYACLLCYVLWEVVRTVSAGHGVPLEELSALGIWGELARYYVALYLFRMAVSQMSVGLWRLLGLNMRDNYHSPLLARNLLDFWRRWDMLWREFLISAVYYPVACRLARAWGPKNRAVYLIAAWSAFMTEGVISAVNLSLIHFHLDVPAPVELLLVYYCVLGLAVGCNAFLAAGGAPRKPAAKWVTAAKIAATFGFISLTHLFFPHFHLAYSLHARLHILWRAIGM